MSKFSKAVYSFDVFETCLIRRLAYPEDLIYRVAEDILCSNSSSWGASDVANLVELRQKAESLARKANNLEDISLNEIYDFFDERNIYRIAAVEFRTKELEFEEKLLSPIKQTLLQIKQLRNAGKRVIFISDMYLPHEFIAMMLTKYGFLVKDTDLYVSGNLHKTKRSGSLFEHILSEEKLSPDQVVHMGDNPVTDYEAAKSIGVDAVLFRKSQLTRYELAMSRIPSKSLDPSKLAGVVRGARLGSYYEEEELNELHALATNVVGPLLVAFTLWLADRAQVKGVERLYFVARDGQILKLISDKLATYKKIPETQYLYGSRQAWFVSSVQDCRKSELDWLLLPGQSKSLVSLFKKLNIKIEDVEQELKSYGFSNLEDDLKSAEEELFWKFLTQPKISELVEKRAMSSRKSALNYFRQEGLLEENKKWALVDAGWTLKTQKALKKILLSAGYQREVEGFFLGLSKLRLKDSKEYGSAEGFSVEPHDGFLANGEGWLFRYNALIEQVFTVSDHSSTLGYVEGENSVSPDFGGKEITEKQLRLAQVMQHGVLAVAESIFSEGLQNDHAALRSVAFENLELFLSKPNISEVNCLNKVLIGDDQNESNKTPLTNKLKPWVVLPQKLERLMPKSLRTEFYWIEGSLAQSSSIIRKIFFLKKEIGKFFKKI